jgi:hypothetical protein
MSEDQIKARIEELQRKLKAREARELVRPARRGGRS